jgi:hypothetical protein
LTLVKGNHLIKLDEKGEPLTTEREAYIEFEVEELTTHFTHSRLVPSPQQPFEGGETYVVALLRKVR